MRKPKKPRRLLRRPPFSVAAKYARLPEAARVAAFDELLFAVDERDGYVSRLEAELERLRLAVAHSVALSNELATITVGAGERRRPKAVRVFT